MKPVLQKWPWLRKLKIKRSRLIKHLSPLRASFLLHLILLLLVGGQFNNGKPVKDVEVFTVDLVKLSKVDRISTKAPDNSKNNAAKQKVVKSAMAKPTQATPQQKPQNLPQAKANPNSKSNTAIQPQAKKLEPQKELAQEPKKIAKKETKTNKAKSDKDANDKSLLKDLKAKKSSSGAKPKQLTANIDKNFAIGDENRHAQLTVSEQTLIRSQIQRAWIDIPAGAKGISDLAITLLIELREDGSVSKIQLKSKIDPGNPVARAFASSAIRATYRASPIKFLPVEKFHTWRELELTFDARDLL